MSNMKTSGNQLDLRALRESHGLSQSKLAEITSIVQARISAYELGGNGLNQEELASIQAALDNLDESTVQQLKVKRYRRHGRTGKAIASRPRRSYSKTDGNNEYCSRYRRKRRSRKVTSLRRPSHCSLVVVVCAMG